VKSDETNQISGEKDQLHLLLEIDWGMAFWDWILKVEDLESLDSSVEAVRIWVAVLALFPEVIR